LSRELLTALDGSITEEHAPFNASGDDVMNGSGSTDGEQDRPGPAF
jgi:hypothetical protein